MLHIGKEIYISNELFYNYTDERMCKKKLMNEGEGGVDNSYIKDISIWAGYYFVIWFSFDLCIILLI